MARVNIENGQLVISMKGARKFFAFKNEISIPLSNVIGVTSGLEWNDLPDLLERVSAGSNIPGFYYGGTFAQDGDKVFYDIKKKEEAVIIMLKDEDIERIVIGVDDPVAIIEYIEKSINK